MNKPITSTELDEIILETINGEPATFGRKFDRDWDALLVKPEQFPVSPACSITIRCPFKPQISQLDAADKILSQAT